MDALVAIDIILALVNRKHAMNCGGQTEASTNAAGHFIRWDSPEFTDILHSMCEPLLDIGYSSKASRVNQVWWNLSFSNL